MTDENQGADSARVTFHPQEWKHEHAVSAGNYISFEVPVEDVIDENGDLIEDDSYESDELKHHKNAPEEVREWSGPFYFTIDELL